MDNFEVCHVLNHSSEEWRTRKAGQSLPHHTAFGLLDELAPLGHGADRLGRRRVGTNSRQDMLLELLEGISGLLERLCKLCLLLDFRPHPAWPVRGNTKASCLSPLN